MYKCLHILFLFSLAETSFRKRRTINGNTEQSRHSIPTEFPKKSTTLLKHRVVGNTSLKTVVYSEQYKRKHHLKKSCEKQTRVYADSLYFEQNFPIPHYKTFGSPDKFHDFASEYANDQNWNQESVFSLYSGAKELSYVPSSSRYFCNTEYDFCICSVPKSGCTFWSQIFQVLGSDTYTYNSVFNKPRILVHKPGLKYSANFRDVVRNNTRTILIARDPYSRLYSAFIDKVYLPSSGNIFANHIKRILSRLNGVKVEENNRCKLSNVTFQDFLTYVIREARADNSFSQMNIHWRPISALCIPCLVNPVAIVKQESFSEDVEHALTILEIDSKKYDFLIDVLHNRSNDIRIRELVSNFELFQRISRRKRRKRSCIQASEIASRLWHALQIQGYIDKSAPFPDHMKYSESDKFYWKTFRNLITEVREKYPMDSLKVRQQRRAYLVGAYKAIDKHKIRELQNIYRKDFELYAYDNRPPRA